MPRWRAIIFNFPKNSKFVEIWSNYVWIWPNLVKKFEKFGQIWVTGDPGNLEKLGKNFKMWWKMCQKPKKVPVKNAKISKSGLFQTAGAAQPMEPWKKRRPFCRGKTMADHMSFVRKQPGGHGWAVKLSQSRVNLGILPAASFSKNSFFSRVTKTPKGSRYRDSVRASEFATSGPSILKMCQKWIGATGEPGNCVKVGWICRNFTGRFFCVIVYSVYSGELESWFSPVSLDGWGGGGV